MAKAATSSIVGALGEAHRAPPSPGVLEVAVIAGLVGGISANRRATAKFGGGKRREGAKRAALLLATGVQSNFHAMSSSNLG